MARRQRIRQENDHQEKAQRNKNALHEAQLGEARQRIEGLEAELAKLREQRLEDHTKSGERRLVMEQRLLALEAGAARDKQHMASSTIAETRAESPADGVSSAASPAGRGINASNSFLRLTLFPGKMHLVVE